MSIWTKIVNWFKNSNKPCVAQEAIRLAAVGLHETVKGIKKLDERYTNETILDEILKEYKK